MYELKDQELIYLVEENNDEAFETLYRKYEYLVSIKIKKYSSVIHVLNLDKQEVYQEFLIAFVKAIKSYDLKEKINFKNYALNIIDKKFIDILRRKSTKINEHFNFLELDQEIGDNGQRLIDFLIDKNMNIENNLILKDTLMNLNNLSSLEIKIIEYLINGYRIDDIAKITHLNKKQIYNTIYRLKQKIKEIIM